MTGLLEIVTMQPPEAAPYGLLSLRDPDVIADERWIGGFTYESLTCSTEVNLLDVCGGNDATNVVAAETDPKIGTYTPFVVETVDKCSTFGWTKRDVERRAVAALELCTQKAVEREFWMGTAATANGYSENRYLASSDSVDVTPGASAVKVRYGLALLEKALAENGCGARGVIHVTHDVASVLPIKVVDDHLETQLGNYVVAGTGYTGAGPDGNVPATGTWMYATGMVQVFLGPAEAIGANMSQQVDTSVNTWEVRAHRPAAIVWDGCAAFAVHVDLAQDYA